PLDGSIDFVLQQGAAESVAIAAGPTLIPVDDSGNAFHVERNPDLHQFSLSEDAGAFAARKAFVAGGAHIESGGADDFCRNPLEQEGCLSLQGIRCPAMSGRTTGAARSESHADQSAGRQDPMLLDFLFGPLKVGCLARQSNPSRRFRCEQLLNLERHLRPWLPGRRLLHHVRLATGARVRE
ncbi:MAG: hypothetical protein QOI36_2295, partial [Pseudonocardiales bacterium]|nr:hypothetical protein [Pseudonocardiales bacterium]